MTFHPNVFISFSSWSVICSLLFTHFCSPENSQALKRLMRRVRRPSTFVAIPGRSCSLSEMSREVSAPLFDLIGLLPRTPNSRLLSAVSFYTPSLSSLHRGRRDWSRSGARRSCRWSRPPVGPDHLERGQVTDTKRGNRPPAEQPGG